MDKVVFVVIFQLLLGANFASSQSLPETRQQLYHGDPVPDNSYKALFPYMVAIMLNGEYWCGGVLIRPNYVLTAAHCVNVTADQLKIHAGFVNIGNSFATREQYRLVKDIIFYNKFSKYRDEDIALLRLTNSFNITKFVNVINLPSDAYQLDRYGGKNTVLLGWGLTHGGVYSSKLRSTTLTILSKYNCTEIIQADSERVLCGLDVNDGKRGGCFGDSGGPLVIHHYAMPKKDVLVGIHVFGYNLKQRISPKLCDTSMPSVSVNVEYYKTWIENIFLRS